MQADSTLYKNYHSSYLSSPPSLRVSYTVHEGWVRSPVTSVREKSPNTPFAVVGVLLKMEGKKKKPALLLNTSQDSGTTAQEQNEYLPEQIVSTK